MRDVNTFPTSLRRRLVAITRRLTHAMSQVGMSILLVFATSTLLDGLFRGLLNQPIDLVRDIGGVTIAVAMACCFPQAFLEQHNIAITLIDGRLSSGGRRLLLLGVAVVVEFVVVLFAWQFFVHAGKVSRAGEMSVAYNVPLAPFWYVVDACFWMTAVAQVIVVIDRALAALEADDTDLLRSDVPAI